MESIGGIGGTCGSGDEPPPATALGWLGLGQTDQTDEERIEAADRYAEEFDRCRPPDAPPCAAPAPAAVEAVADTVAGAGLDALDHVPVFGGDESDAWPAPG